MLWREEPEQHRHKKTADINQGFVGLWNINRSHFFWLSFSWPVLPRHSLTC